MARINGKIELWEDYTLKQMTSFEGHEGEPCVQGTIFKGRKEIGSYSDDTHGGSAWLRWTLDGREEFDALKAHAESLPPHTLEEPQWDERLGRPEGYTPLTVPMDLELFISLAIDEHLQANAVKMAIAETRKDIKRKMKRQAVYAVVGKSDSWGLINRPYEGHEKEIHDYLNKRFGADGYVVANQNFDRFMGIITAGLK